MLPKIITEFDSEMLCGVGLLTKEEMRRKGKGMIADIQMTIVNKNWGEAAHDVAVDYFDEDSIVLSGDDKIGFAHINTSVEGDDDTVLLSKSAVMLDVYEKILSIADRAMIVDVNVKASGSGVGCMVTMRNKDVVVYNMNEDKVYLCSMLKIDNIVGV